LTVIALRGERRGHCEFMPGPIDAWLRTWNCGRTAGWHSHPTLCKKQKNKQRNR
jgi:hypothetical protein